MMIDKRKLEDRAGKKGGEGEYYTEIKKSDG
jgi:hypothetical protein